MKKYLKRCFIMLVVFAAAIIAGFSLLCITYSLPTHKAATHVRESGNILAAEGDYWSLLPNAPTTVLDNYTDSIMLLTAAYDGEEGVIDKSVNNYKVYAKGSTKQESCQVCGLVPEKQKKVSSYARYWHGYVVFLKPLLLFLNLGQIRDLNMICILGYICLTCILLSREKLSKFLIPYLLACCFINPATVSASLQNSTIFHVTSLSILILLFFYKKRGFQNYLWIFYMMIGIATSYVDLLTYPVVSLAFPLAVFLMLTKETRFFQNLKSLILYSGMWCIGYAGMWISKWGLSTLLMGKNYFSEGAQTFLKRSGNVVGDTKVTLFEVYQSLYGYLKDSTFLYLLLLLGFLWIIALLLFHTNKKQWPVSFSFLLLSLYPFIWAFFTQNHTYIHTMFTYRGLSVFVLGIPCSLLSFIDFSNVNEYTKKLLQKAFLKKSHK